MPAPARPRPRPSTWRSFAGKRLRAGVGAGTTQASGSSAALEVAVDTTYDGTAEQLETSRSTTGVPAGSTTAATARLALVGETQPIVYSALATDSSGGAGAAQPAPEAMQVKFLAEGLDGLADAVGNALDGAAPRNTGPGGVPVSAPLIGSDLDAGANVRGVLTGLTSALRTQLAGVTATSATDLADALATRTDAAVRTAPGVSGDGATAEVTCAQGKDCVPCPDDADGNPTSCAADGPKAWDTVRIHTTLTGDARTGKTQFEVGLDGLSVTSDKEVDTSTSWTLPITLELKRGVGPRVVVDAGDTLALDASAALPTGGACATGTHCIKAIVGYLPAKLTATGADGTVDVGVRVKPAAGAYDLFDLYDGSLKAVPGFSDEGALHDEDGTAARLRDAVLRPPAPSTCSARSTCRGPRPTASPT